MVRMRWTVTRTIDLRAPLISQPLAFQFEQPGAEHPGAWPCSYVAFLVLLDDDKPVGKWVMRTALSVVMIDCPRG
jgi:hypothetical protein